MSLTTSTSVVLAGLTLALGAFFLAPSAAHAAQEQGCCPACACCDKGCACEGCACDAGGCCAGECCCN